MPPLSFLPYLKAYLRAAFTCVESGLGRETDKYKWAIEKAAADDAAVAVAVAVANLPRLRTTA